MVVGVCVSAVYVEGLGAHMFLTVWHVHCPHASLHPEISYSIESQDLYHCPLVVN